MARRSLFRAVDAYDGPSILISGCLSLFWAIDAYFWLWIDMMGHPMLISGWRGIDTAS